MVSLESEPYHWRSIAGPLFLWKLPYDLDPRRGEPAQTNRDYQGEFEAIGAFLECPGSFGEAHCDRWTAALAETQVSRPVEVGAAVSSARNGSRCRQQGLRRDAAGAKNWFSMCGINSPKVVLIQPMTFGDCDTYFFFTFYTH